MSKVKSVISGDSLVLASASGDRTVSLAYVTAPRVDSQQGGFCGRELLRTLLVGKPVQVRTVYTAQDREFVDIRSPVFDSLVEKVLADGAAKLRDDAPVKPGFESVESALKTAQETARTKKRGLWGAGNIKLVKDCPLELHGSGRQVPSIVEKVISGDRVIVRAMMDPDYHFSGPVLLAGIRSPRSTGPQGPGEPFGDAARDLVSQRLLQRNIRCVFIAAGPGDLPLVTLIHPAGDIATSLVGAGLAKFAENQTSIIGSDRSLELRKAESSAKKSGYNIWKANADASAARTASASNTTVQKIVSGDTIVLDDDRTVQLSSIVAPRRNNPDTAPWFDAAKEYLRALTIGREVEVLVDGTRQDNERELVTVALDGKNVAEHIVAAGYAGVRQGNGQSPFVAELLSAEEKAKQQKRGIWGKPPSGAKQVDASESQVRAKAYLSALERRGRIPGVVDYVAPQGGRMRVIVPSENCILSVVCAGIKVPRNSEPGADQVTDYVNKNYLQRDVEIKVYGTDKTGAFTAQTYLRGKKIALGNYLLSEGLASVFEPAANEYGLRKEFDALQESACDARKGIWVDYVPEEPKQVTPAASTTTATEAVEAPVSAARPALQDAVITATTSHTVSYRLSSDDGKFKELSTQLAQFFTAGANSSAHAFAKTPRRNDNVVYKKGLQFFRAKIEEVNPYSLVLLDTGAQVEAKLEELRPLPAQFAVTTLPALASTERLAYIHAPPRDYKKYITEHLRKFLGTQVVVSVAGAGVIVYTEDSESPNDNLNSRLIDNGYTYLTGGDSSSIYKHLKELEAAGMRDRVGIWEYGDPRDDDL